MFKGCSFHSYLYLEFEHTQEITARGLKVLNVNFRMDNLHPPWENAQMVCISKMRWTPASYPTTKLPLHFSSVRDSTYQGHGDNFLLFLMVLTLASIANRFSYLPKAREKSGGRVTPTEITHSQPNVPTSSDSTFNLES